MSTPAAAGHAQSDDTDRGYGRTHALNNINMVHKASNWTFNDNFIVLVFRGNWLNMSTRDPSLTSSPRR